jgi:arylsulfatase A-like enzyme
LPSQASLLTGRYPHEHGATWPDLRLADSVETLASVLAASGYATGAFSGNSSWVTPEYLGRGFARFHSQTLEDELRRTFVGRAAQPVLNAIGLHAAGRGKHAARVGEEFAAFLDDVGTRPVFAYLCFMDVNRDMHRARLNRPFWRRTAQTAEVVGAYDSALTALDAQVGLVLADLKARGRFENSIIVVASDHGESFGAGSAHDHDPSGHGTSLFPEQSAIPLWIRMPGQTPRRVDDPVTLRDVPATIVASLGLPRGAVGGRSLFDSPTSPAAAELRYHTYWGNSIAAGSWFFLEHGDSAAPQRQLFNYAEDPFATSAVEMTAVAADLQALLHRTLGRKVSQPDAAGTTAR